MQGKGNQAAVEVLWVDPLNGPPHSRAPIYFPPHFSRRPQRMALLSEARHSSSCRLPNSWLPSQNHLRVIVPLRTPLNYQV